MEIKRNVYINRLINRKHNGFVKVITGIRRCGKSYLLNTLFYNQLISEGIDKEHIILFAFDSADDLIMIGEDPILLANSKEDRKVDPKKFLKYVSSRIMDDKMYYLLLDEIQELGAFESVLNGFLRKKNMDVYVTGSNSRFLSKDILTEFEGRGDEVHMLPLAFSEFFSVYKGSKEEAFDDYSVYGGLPAVALMGTEEQKINYLITQVNNLYIRDIIDRYHLQSNTAIGELLDVISSGISTLTNPRKLSATFASVKQTTISELTVDRYIGYMEDAFMINRVKRYDVKGRKYIGTPYKIYFEDIGLRNARLNFRQIEETHIMENIIYNELRFRGYKVDVGVVESREKDETGKEIRKQLEIDFIAALGSKKYYIQSAYAIPDEEKYKQETRPLDKVNDSFKKIILVEKSMKPRIDDSGYVCMGVKEFLLDTEIQEA
ncbi:MAG TPA: ATP-binding protein [Lachnospiraceae bacterium]|nr:ATP-binding protein [Lachnospiraceae bacterium]